MQKVIIIPLLALTLSSCSLFSSPEATLATLQDAAIASRMTIRPVIDAICEEEQRRCNAEHKVVSALLVEDSTDCPGFDVCQQVRIIIINTLEAVQFAIADANLALALGQDDQYDAAIARAAELLAQVQNQMQLLGIIPGEDNAEAQ